MKYECLVVKTAEAIFRYTLPMALMPEIADLRTLVGRELDPLLLEETVEWDRTLDWDFARSAELVRQYADVRALAGAALLDKGEVVGYGYSVVEDHKGLIGDLYVRLPWREGPASLELFLSLLDALTRTPRLQRIESQLMLVERGSAEALQRERSVKLYERILMSCECSVPTLPGRQRGNDRRFSMQPWADHHNESAAGVIALSYLNHVDSQINDQYRSLAGARRFLYNIVQFPGCGVFFKPGSIVAIDLETDWVAGIALVSFVGPETGHIMQLCITPNCQGCGLGSDLLRQSIALLCLNGAKRVSLTVTRANKAAISLYRRFGFTEVRRFFAYVWEP